MVKILLIILAIVMLAFIVVAMYSAMIVGSRYDDKKNSNNNQGKDDKFWKKKMCSKCKTGKYTYELDPRSEICPYIGCFEKGKCRFFEPLEKPTKAGRSKLKKEENILL